ncbi:MAG: ABC transporter permease [Tannerella sp.]|jgi:ABC-type lipoprotein release transport system permease subunit|nr:ABC transporter permease [Tannerella sp.]
MFKHYLKVAFRNLRKYKSQTLISVIGLAVGFTCFALAMLWIRYEMTYDSFHKNADRIYCVSIPDVFASNGISRTMPHPLAAYLKETFPEISHSIPIIPPYSYDKIKIEGIEYPVDIIEIDSTFFNMFDVKIVEGNRNFLIPKSNKAAITQEKARALFGKENPIGKTVKRFSKEYTICAVVTGLPKRSNYPFDFLIAFNGTSDWRLSRGEHTLIELASGIDMEAFKKKLYEHKVKNEMDISLGEMTVTPLTTVRYEDTNIQREVKFEHIKLFALAGVLVILCTLFNYLTLFVSRFRIRQKELALRRVCGASGRSLFTLLSVEFILALLIALFFGLIFIHAVHRPFQVLSEIQMDLSAIYGETLLYIGAVILFSLLSFWTVLAIFRRRTIHSVIRNGNKSVFRKVSVVVQLIISIGFAFCSIVIVKQMYFLHNSADLGFAFKNRGDVGIWFEGFDISVLENQIKQIPEITETLSGLQPMLPLNGRSSRGINQWDGKADDDKEIFIEEMRISEQYVNYYEFRLIEGEQITDKDDKKMVLINESAAKAFGWNKSTGKSFGDWNHNSFIVKGVIKNIYNLAPTVPVKPLFYRNSWKNEEYYHIVLFKYREGTWNMCKNHIERLLKDKFPEIQVSHIFNAEEIYDTFFKSENALLKILSFVSLVCMIICIFGFVSLVSLTCEERRKEIAIRKINGATAKDILSIFFREYFQLLVAGAVIAFPVGYYIMRVWLEQYVKQTAIPAWIYLLILLALILVIVLCVGWRVYKASVENPAEVVKN